MGSLDRENATLRRILAVARDMASRMDLGGLLEMIIESTCQVLDCERATVFLYDADTDELWARVATGDADIRFPADRGIAGTAAKSRVAVNVPDAYADPRFNQAVDRDTGFRTRNLLTVPMENVEGDLIGVLQALNKREGAFDDADIELLAVLAAQAGVAIHRQHLLEQYAEKQRIERDLQLARKIQLDLFPEKPPIVAGYDVAGWNLSADETGGDCYDFIPMSDGRVAVVLADATGHGIGAALVIAQCRSMLRAMLSVTDDLQQIADKVNVLLAQDLADNRFVTCYLGVLDPTAHKITYVSAGQGPLLWLVADKVEQRMANGLPLATIEDVPYDEIDEFAFEPGAMLVLLTDGFFEASNPDGELFGEARVSQYCQQHAGQPLDQLITGLHDQVREFCAGGKQADDLTAVLIRRSR